MKIYIAGKITGDPNYHTKFCKAKLELLRHGLRPAILNPASLPEGMDLCDYSRICVAMMESADVVAFLPDWQDSRGARLEHGWCQYVGKQTMYL